MKLIKHHWELDVYKLSLEIGMDIFNASKRWPKEEMYSLTDQIRRSSRAVAAAIAEACRRRKYEAVFVNKLNEAEGEAAETQTWLEFAVRCSYFDRKEGARLFRSCDHVIGKLVKMGNEPEKWLLAKSRPRS
jgi:four helix bundle protein